MTPDLITILQDSGYFFIREIEGRGLCALRRMVFTVGLFVDLDEEGSNGRYCFPSLQEAVHSILSWDGKDDPDGDWIKFKGPKEERKNPRYGA